LELTLLEVLWGCMNQLKRNQLEAALLESTDDLSDEGAMDTIGLQFIWYSDHCDLVVRYENCVTLTMI
jgi:hypothetical protein